MSWSYRARVRDSGCRWRQPRSSACRSSAPTCPPFGKSRPWGRSLCRAHRDRRHSPPPCFAPSSLRPPARAITPSTREAGDGQGRDGLWVNAVEDLLADPPCDVALVRPDTAPIRSVLVPVRGGPSAELALRLASTVCKQHGAELCVLHIFNPRISDESRAREEKAFLKLSSAVDVPVRRITLFSTAVREAIVREAAQHQLVVLGATMSLMHRPMVLGAPVGRLLRRLPGSGMVVKGGGPATELQDADRPFRLDSRAAAAERVDRWFAENTFHSREFGDLRRVVAPQTPPGGPPTPRRPAPHAPATEVRCGNPGAGRRAGDRAGRAATAEPLLSRAFGPGAAARG